MSYFRTISCTILGTAWGSEAGESLVYSLQANKVQMCLNSENIQLKIFEEGAEAKKLFEYIKKKEKLILNRTNNKVLSKIVIK